MVFSRVTKVAAVAFLSAVAQIAAVLPAGAQSPGGQQDGAGEGFRVISMTPLGELPSQVKYPSIQVQFSEPVVALKALGTQSSSSEYLTIEPKLNGVFRWKGTSILSFDSTDEVLPQKEYTVKVSPKTKSVKGNTITGQLEYGFHTEELKLTSVCPAYAEFKEGRYVNNSSVPLEAARDIGVFFNFPVNCAVVKDYITVTDSSGKSLPFTAAQNQKVKDEKNFIRLTLDAQPPEDTDIIVTLRKGAVADRDCYPTSADRQNRFHTLVKFRITSVDWSRSSRNANDDFPVYVSFSAPLKEGSEEDLARSISTSLGKAVTKDNLAVSGSCLTLSKLGVKHGDKYKILVAKTLTDIYGRQLDKDCSYDITVPQPESYALFQNSGFKALEENAAPSITFYHQNIKAGSYYKVESLSGTSAKTFALDPSRIEQNKKITEVVDLRPFLKESGGIYHGAVKFTAHIVYEYAPSWRKEGPSLETMENEQLLQVTDLGVTARYAYDKAVLLVTSLKDGKPVAGADVSAYFIPHPDYDKQETILTGSYKAVATAVTNKDGIAEFDFSAGGDKSLLDRNDNAGLYFEARTKDDRVLYSPGSYYGIVRYRSEPVYTKALIENSASPDEPEVAEDIHKRMVAYGFSDRRLYKPGETVSFTLIDRNLLRDGRYETPSGNEAKYTIQLTDGGWRNAKVYYSGEGTLDGEGMMSAVMKLPDDIAPGSYTISYKRKCGTGASASEQTYNESIDVQFFEKLRFEASTNIADLTYFKGDTLSAEVQASYLGGGSMGGAQARSFWSSDSGYFSPKGDDYKGMSFTPLEHTVWHNWHGDENGSLDGDGKLSSSHSTKDDGFDGFPRTYTVETQISDSGNQAVRTTASTTVHPARYYLGIGSAKKGGRGSAGFPKKGEQVSFLYTAITPLEKLPSARDRGKNTKIKMELVHESWKSVQEMNARGVVTTRWVRELVTEEEKELSFPSSAKPASFSVKPKDGGVYKIRLSAADGDGNSVVSERSFYVISSDWYYRGNNGDAITLKADKEEYNVGDTASILLESPLEKGKYLVCVEREKLISHKVIDIDSPVSEIKIPIEESYVPVVYVSLSSFSESGGKTGAEELTRSVFGVTSLNVSTKSRSIDIEIRTDQKSYEPGSKVTLTLRASKDGKPVPNARIAVQAVDRGVLDLIDYHVESPVNRFYARWLFNDGASGGDSRSLLVAQEEETEAAEEEAMLMGASNGTRMLYKSAATADMAVAESAMEADAGGEDGGMKVRKNFASTAYYNPSIVTGKDGKATVTFTLPDSITAYRLTAAVVKADLFGIGEEEMSVAEPISARPVLPRVLRLDDKGEVGLTISNLKSSASEVSVRLEILEGTEAADEKQNASSVQKLPGRASVKGKDMKKLKVAANTTKALMFDITAEKQGWITLAFTLTGKDINEKMLLPLEIEKPYIFETVTTVGSVEGGDGARELLVLPGDAEDGRGSLYVQLDPTRLGVLREAISYVFHYPYGCLEQRSSATLPLVAFGDYIKLFGLESEVVYPKGVAESEIRSWAGSQRSDGGFPYWPGGSESSNYVSMRIAEILALAKENGIPAGDIKQERLASYLINNADENLRKYPGQAWSLYTAAYAYYAAERIGGKVDDANLDKILASDEADVETLALVGLTYLNKGNAEKARTVATKLRSFTRLTARGIDITGKYEGHRWCFLNDTSEKYALYLQFFTKLDRRDEVNQHLVYELLKMQRAGNGYWKSTVATSRVLIALNSYIKENKLENLDFTAQALLGGKELLSGSFKGVTAEAVESEVQFGGKELKKLARDKELALDFTKSGTGTLYYTASMRYAVPAGKQTAWDEGICVYTEIYDAETGEKVSGDKLVSGRLYRETICLSSTMDLEFVALRAPVPAGAEILNSAFVTTISAPESQKEKAEKAYPWWGVRNYGLSYKKIYDDEVQYFWNYMRRGSQNIEFVFRATRTGSYGTPAATAECMYEEEIFGRSDGKVWKIE